MKKGIQDLREAGKARRGVPRVGAAWQAGLLPTWSAAAAGGAGLQEGRGVGWGDRAGPLAAAGARICSSGTLSPPLARAPRLLLRLGRWGPHSLSQSYSPLPPKIVP